MGKIAKVQEVTLSLLRPYEKNAKIHGSGQIEKLKASIKEFGFLTPCLIDNEYNLIAGHGRVMAAQELGMESVPCVFVEGLSDAQRRAYILADNRLGELGEWDSEIVQSELQSLLESGFDIELTGFELDDTIDNVSDLNDSGLTEEIKEWLTEETISQRGQVWKLGNHRLMVGDSTSLDDVCKLVGGGGD